MSNIIPPLLSNTPPPIIGSLDDEEEDEFGHFTSAVDLSYNCEVLSVPPSPLRSPPPNDKRDINSNTDANINQVFNYVSDTCFMPVDKNYQDKRKQCDTSLPALSEIKVNLTLTGEPPVDITVNSHAKPEVESVPSEEAEVNTSVPDLVEHRKNVPSNQNDIVDQGEESEAKPPDLQEELSPMSTRQKPDFVFNEEPPKLDNHEDDDQFDNFTHYESESHPHNPSQEHYLNEGREIECNAESLSNVHEAMKNQEIISNSGRIDSNSFHIEGNPKGEDTITSVPETTEFQVDNETNSSIMSLPPMKDEEELEEISEFAEFQTSDVESDSKDSRLHVKSPSKDVEQTRDFAEFQTPSTSDVSGQEELPQFADFASFPVETEAKSFPEDDFGHFCDFQDAEPQNCEGDNDEDDEFGDFGDYTQNKISSVDAPIIPDSRNILRKAEKIIVDMFPAVLQESCPSASENIEFVQNPVFQEVKDITETKALTYQWIKSSCQDNLLKALNIDTRNILYGPGWNPSMPKFAANLSFAPLQPMKSDILMPIPSQASQESPTPSNAQPDIPSAQFDWSGSGLTNPLDYMQANTMLLDLEQLVASLDLTTTSSLTPYAPSPSDDFDEWEFWLKSLQKDNKENFSPKSSHCDLPQTPTNNFDHTTRSQGDNDSVNSLQFVTDMTQDSEETKGKQTTEENVIKTEDDFGDFASYQSPSKKKTRNKTSEIENTEPGWLKPTILTPDVKRKMEPDDFTDFQMVLPSASENKNNSESVPIFPATILEPLKPTVLKQPIQVSAEPLQINWPAPGLTDDDIKNIELSYLNGGLQPKPDTPKTKRNTNEIVASNSKALETSSSSQKPKTETQIVPTFDNSSSSHKAKPEMSSNDDDDWSDFVCNPVTAPLTTAAGRMQFPGLHQSERSSTPELQLSVPQLTHLHPPKAPIPVITPNGLIQTKIPSNILGINTSSFQPSIPMYSPLQANAHFQPSIISNQYQNHMNGPVFSQVTKNGFTPSQTSTIKTTSTKNEDDDDDWTDFISSPPAQNIKLQNGVAKTPDWNRVLTPNIITNPVHFDSYRGYASQNSAKKVLVKPKQLTIPSISALPDLDFIAPKSRTFTKK